MSTPSVSGAQLLDLPPDLLLRVLVQLPFLERLRLSGMCRKLRALCAGPSELWRRVEAHVRISQLTYTVKDADKLMKALRGYHAWLGPRLAAVEELHMKVDSLPWMPSLQLSLLRTAVKGVGMAAGGAGPLPLAKLSFDWDGGLDLECTVEQLDRLQSLRKVAIFGAHFDVVVRMPPFSTLPSLTDFSLIGGHLEDESVLDGPWLPPTLTALCLSEDRLERLPGVLRHLPALRSLVIDANHFDVEDKAVELEPQGLNALRFVTALEELNLSACLIADPLPQLATLTRLRVLYLHGCMPEGESLFSWEVLRPLTRIVFLAISQNRLEQLPPVVAGMAHLQALHCEQNALTSLPIGPYLFGLRELLLDWSTALQSPVALRAATQLSRLMLHAKFDVFDDEPNEEAYRPVPAGSGAALLDALASMPALRCVDDVFEGDSGQHVVTAEAASVMWQLGRRCPHLELGLPDSCNVGWTLATLVAELPHNAGGTRLA